MDIGDLDVDDLFGDGAAFELAPGPKPMVAALRHRIDQMNRSGSCRGVAWWAGGTLASITADGLSVEFRYLRCNPDSGEWGLSEPTLYTRLSHERLPGSTLVHLEWSASAVSGELAIVDSFGRVYITSFLSSLNVPQVHRSWDADPIEDSAVIVGSFAVKPCSTTRGKPVTWYGPPQRPSSPAAAIIYPVTAREAPEPPIFPLPKTLFVFVTATGLLRLIWTSPRLQEQSTDMEVLAGSDELVTHASVCADSNSLLIAVATTAFQLCVLRVKLLWSAPPPSQTQAAYLQLSVDIQRLATTSFSLSSSSFVGASVPHHISLLRIFSATSMVPPLVLLTRTVMPNPTELQDPVATVLEAWQLCQQGLISSPAFAQLADNQMDVPSDQPPVTLLQSVPSIVLDNKIILDISLMPDGDAIALAFSNGSVQFLNRSTLAEMWAEPNPECNMVCSLQELGFSFREGVPCLQMAFSPSAFSCVWICEDGKLRWHSVSRPYDQQDIGDSMEAGKMRSYLLVCVSMHDVLTSTGTATYSGLVATLATAIANCTCNSQCFNDVLALARGFPHLPHFTRDVCVELARCLDQTLIFDVPPSESLSLNSPWIPVLASVFAHLHYPAYYQTRPVVNLVLTSTLKIKHILFLTGTIIVTRIPGRLNKLFVDDAGMSLPPTSTHGKPPVCAACPSRIALTLHEHVSSPATVDYLCNCAVWMRDLATWIIAKLWWLLTDSTFMGMLQQEATFPDAIAYLRSEPDPALHLCLSSLSRNFLLLACRRIEYLHVVASKSMLRYESKSEPFTARAYSNMCASLGDTAGSINPVDLDKLLVGLAAKIHAAHEPEGGNPEGPSPQTRALTEQQILFGESLPTLLLPVLRSFLDEDVRQFTSGLRMEDIVFRKFPWLDIEYDERLLRQRRSSNTFIDVFSHGLVIFPRSVNEASRESLDKSPISTPAAACYDGESELTGWRRCVRCGTVLVEPTHMAPSLQVLCQHLFKRCPCSASWTVLEKGSPVP